MSFTVGETAKVVAEHVKRNGELDKCKHEVLNKVVNSDYMKRYIEECNRFVKESLEKYPHNGDISKMRDFLRNEIKQKYAYKSVINYADKLMKENEGFSKLNDTIEKIARSELGLPPPDSNVELVDMEVSSGKSSFSSSTSSASSKSNYSKNSNSEKSDKSNASYRCNNAPSSFSVSRSPSPISDDSLPPYDKDKSGSFKNSNATKK